MRFIMKKHSKESNPTFRQRIRIRFQKYRLITILFLIIILLSSLLFYFSNSINKSYNSDMKSFDLPDAQDPNLSTSTTISSSITSSKNTRAELVLPEIIVDFNPKNPFNLDPVNISIETRLGEEITWAYLSITFIKSGNARTGNYFFTRYNATNWYCIIPGDQNQGDTDVTFSVSVWFEDVEVKTQEFDYRVSYMGSWESTDFYDNLLLTYTPESPIANKEVNVTINSIVSTVPIKQAILRVLVEFPGGYSTQEGGVNFTRINSTALFTLIPAYTGGTNVTFWVEAYDEGTHKIMSDKINYIVLTPPSEGDPQFLYIYIYDEVTDDLVSEATVTISNATWQYTDKTLKGIAWSPIALHAGEYVIEVEYEDEVLVKNIRMPDRDNNNTVLQFKFNIAEAKGIIAEFEDEPQWFVYVAFLIMILAWPVFYYSYTGLVKRAKRLELESKKKAISERRERKAASRNILFQQRLETGSPAKAITKKRSFAILKELWHPGIVLNRILTDEDFKVTSVRLMGFFLLGIFGATWAPFYPWWMILLIGVVTAAISYRFVYLALLVLIIFIIGSTAYQYPTFGWLFMIFSLVIAVCSLFEWRFGFLVFLTLFISRLGFAFIVPMLTGLLLSLFLGIAVAIASGIFLTFLVTCGDFTTSSFFSGPPHDYGFITFSEPHVADFMPTDLGDAIASVNDVNLNGMSTILHSNYTSMLPFIQIIIWTVVVFVIVYLYQRYGKEDLIKSLKLSIVPSVILILSSISTTLYFDHSINIGTVLLWLGIIVVMFSAITFAFMNTELFKEFYLGKTREMPIGTRIGEMLTLRKTGFSEIGGLKEIKRELKDTMIGPLLRPKKAKEYGVEPPRGIMMFGPPGCGKTLLMRALATELKVEMVGVRCSDVMSKWYGESEGMIEKLFKAVKERKPCILFLDEIDAIAKRRDFYSADDVTPRLLSIMLSELDGMDEAAGVIVVGATNKPELVDPALMRPGRFDKIIFIPAPNYQSRVEIFKIHLKGKPVSDKLDIEHLARTTEGFSGADIENVVKEAATLAMKRSIRTRKATKITNSDFLKIIPRIKPSLSREMKQEYQRLQADFERKKYASEIKLPPTVEGEDVEWRKKKAKRAIAEIKPRTTKPAWKEKRVPKRGVGYPKPPVDKREKRIRPDRRRVEKWKDVVGLDSSKEFFKNTIENNLQGGK